MLADAEGDIVACGDALRTVSPGRALLLPPPRAPCAALPPPAAPAPAPATATATAAATATATAAGAHSSAGTPSAPGAPTAPSERAPSAPPPQVAGWLGVADVDSVLETEGLDVEYEAGRQQGLGLGAKYLPHNKV